MSNCNFQSNEKIDDLRSYFEVKMKSSSVPCLHVPFFGISQDQGPMGKVFKFWVEFGRCPIVQLQREASEINENWVKSFVISTKIKTEIGQNVYHRHRKTYKNTSFKKILKNIWVTLGIANNVYLVYSQTFSKDKPLFVFLFQLSNIHNMFRLPPWSHGIW